MRTKKLKSTKYSDLLLTGDHTGVAMITVATRLQETRHGNLFRDLLMAIGPKAYTTLAAIPAEKVAQLERNGMDLNKLVAKAAVTFAENLANAYVEALQRNPALGVNVPAYDTLLEKMHAGDVSDESGTVVPMSGPLQ